MIKKKKNKEKSDKKIIDFYCRANRVAAAKIRRLSAACELSVGKAIGRQKNRRLRQKRSWNPARSLCVADPRLIVVDDID